MGRDSTFATKNTSKQGSRKRFVGKVRVTSKFTPVPNPSLDVRTVVEPTAHRVFTTSRPYTVDDGQDIGQ